MTESNNLTDSSLPPSLPPPLPQLVWIVVYLATLIIGLDIGLGVGVLFNILVIIYKTVLPFSPELGETRAWHYPPNQLSEDFDEEELKVGQLCDRQI